MRYEQGAFITQAYYDYNTAAEGKTLHFAIAECYTDHPDACGPMKNKDPDNSFHWKALAYSFSSIDDAKENARRFCKCDTDPGSGTIRDVVSYGINPAHNEKDLLNNFVCFSHYLYDDTHGIGHTLEEAQNNFNNSTSYRRRASVCYTVRQIDIENYLKANGTIKVDAPMLETKPWKTLDSPVVINGVEKSYKVHGIPINGNGSSIKYSLVYADTREPVINLIDLNTTYIHHDKYDMFTYNGDVTLIVTPKLAGKVVAVKGERLDVNNPPPPVYSNSIIIGTDVCKSGYKFEDSACIPVKEQPSH